MNTIHDSIPDPLQKFELAWRRGEMLDVRTFVAEHSTPKRDLLAELVVLNFACWWGYGADPPPVAVYRNWFPELKNDSEVLFELLAIEILHWQHPDREKYLANFPQVSRELNRLFDLLMELRPDKLREWRGRLTQCAIGNPQAVSFEENSDPVIELELSESVALHDQFHIERLAGRGGFKRVYLGIQHSTGRKVAVKQLKETSPELLRRFVSESRIQAALDHQNIPPVAMLGPIDDRPTVLVEKFISAPDWSCFIHDSRTSLRRNLDILLTVSRTVSFAHNRSFVHRDIKPENVLVDDFGQVYLTDWGLAAQVGAATTRDVRLNHVDDDKGRVSGSPFYMAPEVALGRMELTGPATDVFQLGAILYEILTGRGPYGMTPSTAWIRAAGHRIQPLPRSLSKEFRAVVAKAMAQKPSDRYASACEFAADLQCLIEDENVSVCKPPLIARVRRTTRRHKTVSTSFAAAVLVGMLVATGASIVVADKNARLEVSNREVRDLNASLVSKNRELDEKNEALSAVNEALRDERDRLQLALQIGFKLLRGIETDQYHSLDDAYSDIVQNGFRLPDEERSAMLPLYLALVGMKKADDFLTHGPPTGSGVTGLFNNIASKVASNGELGEALEQLNQSIQKCDRVGLAWLLRAQLRMVFLAHPNQEVLDDWDRAVALLPRSSAVFSGRGWNLIGLKRFDQAVIDLTRAIELDPGNEYARYGLAEIMLNREDYASAIEHYHAALELPQRYSVDPNWKRLLYEGTAYSHWGRALRRMSDEDVNGSFDDFLLTLKYCPAKMRPDIWKNLLLVLSVAKADAVLVERLRNTSLVSDSDATSASFQFTRDCIAALFAARASTFEPAEIERLIECSTATPALRVEMTEAVLSELSKLASADAMASETRELLVKLINAVNREGEMK
jgi:serine/threonine protein kinase/Tfp pilus assembly protein PilF